MRVTASLKACVFFVTIVMCRVPLTWALLQISVSAKTSTSAANVSNVTDDVVENLLAQLHAMQDSTNELEGSFEGVRRSLFGAEQTIGAIVNKSTMMRPAVGRLVQGAQVNQRTLRDITLGSGDLRVAAETWMTKVNATVVQVQDADNGTAVVVSSALKVLSLGEIKGRSSGCLDSPAAAENGGRVQVWTCLKAQPSQLWQFNPASGSIRHQNGICLSVSSDQTTVAMQTCSTDSGSKWSYDSATGAVKHSSGKCLSVQDQSVKGSAAKVVTCDVAAKNQKWTLVPGDVGLRQDLDRLNGLLWQLQNPSDQKSLEQTEKQLGILESKVSALEGQIQSKSRGLLVKRLGRGVRRMGRALDQLADAASPDMPAEAISHEPDERIGAGLGIYK